ncbi:MAG: endonuclease/exonuclease/phosphatase family protein [Maribacter sp.]|nr:endonuclease/exonuclease/phosphatase family protein [Maribacter sp.]
MKIKLLLLISIFFVLNSFGKADTLRIMSFNILHGATTKGDFNLDTIAGVINYYKPDLVALQEVDFKTNRAKKYDLPTEIGIRTKMASLFARAMYYDGGEYGEAVLSNLTFIGSENVQLPHQPNSEPRAALVTKVKTKNGNTIQFIGTHLDHLKANTDRLMQAKAIAKSLGQSNIPTLLVGDLNDGAESETLRILYEHFQKPKIPAANLNTWPADNPRVSLDHILFNMPDRWKVLDYKVVCENYASDHCIVVATLVYHPK